MNSQIESPANRCFVCGPSNPIGLKLNFRIDGDVCRAEFTPAEAHMGYQGLTHGGIIFSLLDDVMANWLWLQGERCFTARADIRYRESLPIGTPVRIEGWMVKRKGRLVQLEGRVIRQDSGATIAEASGSFMTD
jgi:acyl-coenzyme A thioesterase PaaI-like protein